METKKYKFREKKEYFKIGTPYYAFKDILAYNFYFNVWFIFIIVWNTVFIIVKIQWLIKKSKVDSEIKRNIFKEFN